MSFANFPWTLHRLGDASSVPLEKALPDDPGSGLELLRLELAGELGRGVLVAGEPILWTQPRRPPPSPPPVEWVDHALRLCPYATIEGTTRGMRISSPLAWACVEIANAELFRHVFVLRLPVALQDLDSDLPRDCLAAALALMAWVGVLVPAGEAAEVSLPWGREALSFHESTRAWSDVRPLGKVGARGEQDHEAGGAQLRVRERLALPVARSGARATMSFGETLGRRRSRRVYGEDPITRDELAAFLQLVGVGGGDENLAAGSSAGERRSYPSGGGLYAVEANLVVGRCGGLAPGIYRVSERGRTLLRIGDACDQMLIDAAAAMGVSDPPQILVVLTVDMRAVLPSYGRLSYRLVLEELGAILQTMYLSAESLGLAGCAIGRGSPDLFSQSSGLHHWNEPSVGEFALGSRR